MARPWSVWILVWCWGVIAFGAFLVTAAIPGMDGAARAVFVLHDVEGYKHEEIAEMTGVATGTSKAQLHRARRLLRTALGR